MDTGAGTPDDAAVIAVAVADALWGLAWFGGLAGVLVVAVKRRRDC